MMENKINTMTHQLGKPYIALSKRMLGRLKQTWHESFETRWLICCDFVAYLQSASFF